MTAIKYARVLIGLAVVGFAVHLIAVNLQTATAQRIWPGAPTLAVVTVLSVLGHLCSLVAWMRIVSACGVPADFARDGRRYFYSRLGRYVPGKFAVVLLRFDAYREVSKRRMGRALALEIGLTLSCVGCVATIGVLGLGSPLGLSDAAVILVPAVTLVALIGVVVIAKSERFFGVGKVAPSGLALGAAAIVAALFVHGLSIYLLTTSLTGESGHDVQRLVYLTIAYYLAGVIGMIALLAPAGLGVRESAFVVIAAPLVAAPAAAGAAIWMRLAVTLAELVLVAVFFFFSRHRNAEPQADY